MKLKKLTIDIEVAQILADASNVEKGRQFSKLLRAMSAGEARADDPAWVREAIGRALTARMGRQAAAENMNRKRYGTSTVTDTQTDTQTDTVTDTLTDTQTDTRTDTQTDTVTDTQTDTQTVESGMNAATPTAKVARACSLLPGNTKNLSNSPLHVPPSSLPGMAEGAAAEEPAATQLLRDRLGMLFRRRPTTRWNDSEKRVLRSIAKRPGVEEELAEIERLYRSGYKYRRKDIKTLLNNWTTELDRAAGYLGERDDRRTFEEQLEDG